MTLFEYRSLEVFTKIDVNGSGTLELKEMEDYFKSVMGYDFDKDKYKES
jgi:hypothetical protein